MFCGTIFCLHLFVLKFSHEQVLSSALVKVRRNIPSRPMMWKRWSSSKGVDWKSTSQGRKLRGVGPEAYLLDNHWKSLNWLSGQLHRCHSYCSHSESLLTLVFPLNSLLDIGCTKVFLSMCYTDRTLVAQEVPRVRAIQITNLNSLLDIGSTRGPQSTCYTDNESE